MNPSKLCRNHLLAEHRELHAIWSILINNKKGYRYHPETLRWEGKLKALYLRHEKLVKEFDTRNYQHKSPLDKKFAIGASIQKVYVDQPSEQEKIMKRKKCKCKV